MNKVKTKVTQFMNFIRRKEVMTVVIALAGWMVIGLLIWRIFLDKEGRTKDVISLSATPVPVESLNGAEAVIDGNGKLYVAGDADNKIDDFILARYFADARLDDTFGVGGKVKTDFAGGEDYATVVVIQKDGKVVLAGQSNNNFALARYLVDGSLDKSFGEDGKVSTDLGGVDSIEAISLQEDGKIVTAGGSSKGDESNFALARLMPDGSLDKSFGDGGKVIIDFGEGTNQALALAIAPDGKIVTAGVAITDKSYNFALARYLVDGSLDKSFGEDGKVSTDFGEETDSASDVVIAPDGKIVAGGVTSGTSTLLNFALARYLANGSLDKSFGNGGKVVTDFGSSDDSINAILLSGDKIVAAGVSKGDFAMARYRPDGSLDKDFSGGGKVTKDWGGLDDQIFALVKVVGDKILSIGYSGGTEGRKLVTWTQ